jgi:hypothetical protein
LIRPGADNNPLDDNASSGRMSESSCRGSAQRDDLLLLGVTTGRNRATAETLTKSLSSPALLAPAPRGRFAFKKLVRSRFVLTGLVALRFP